MSDKYSAHSEKVGDLGGRCWTGPMLPSYILLRFRKSTIPLAQLQVYYVAFKRVLTSKATGKKTKKHLIVSCDTNNYNFFIY